MEPLWIEFEGARKICSIFISTYIYKNMCCRSQERCLMVCWTFYDSTIYMANTDNMIKKKKGKYLQYMLDYQLYVLPVSLLTVCGRAHFCFPWRIALLLVASLLVASAAQWRNHFCATILLENIEIDYTVLRDVLGPDLVQHKLAKKTRNIK